MVQMEKKAVKEKMQILHRGSKGFVLLETLMVLICLLVLISGIFGVYKGMEKSCENLMEKSQQLMEEANEVK